MSSIKSSKRVSLAKACVYGADCAEAFVDLFSAKYFANFYHTQSNMTTYVAAEDKTLIDRFRRLKHGKSSQVKFGKHKQQY